VRMRSLAYYGKVDQVGLCIERQKTLTDREITDREIKDECLVP
jgi:hypothetical protein